MISKKGLLVTVGCILALMCAVVANAETPQFEHVMNIGTKGAGPGQFQYVEDFDFAADGNLLASDALNSNIQVFDKTTGKYISQFGGKSTGFEKPEGISVDKDGNIFVADYQAGFIRKYSKNFKLVKQFSGLGADPGQTNKSEFTDIYDGLLYVPEQGSHRVDVFDLNGTFKFMFGTQGTGDGQLNKPEAAKFNGKGELYVVDLGNHRVQVFDKSGKYLRQFGSKGEGQGQFQRPACISFDKDDNIYITEIDNDRIQVFDKNEKHITMFGKGGAGNGEFKNLHGIKVDKATGWIYAADSGNNRIQVFKPTK